MCVSASMCLDCINNLQSGKPTMLSIKAQDLERNVLVTKLVTLSADG